MAANSLAMGHIFVGKFLGGRQGQLLLFGDGFTGAHRRADLTHGVDGINRRGPSGFERLVNGVNVTTELRQIVSAESERALGQAISRRCTNRPGAPHHHVVNGAGGFAEIFRRDNFEFVGKQALLNEQDRLSRGVEGDGAMMPGAPADGDIHMIRQSV